MKARGYRKPDQDSVKAKIVAAMSPGESAATLERAPGWAVVLVGFVVFGCGAGCYYAVDIALVSQVLPLAGLSLSNCLSTR